MKFRKHDRFEPFLYKGGIFLGSAANGKMDWQERALQEGRTWQDVQLFSTHDHYGSMEEAFKAVREVCRRFYRKYGDKRYCVIAEVQHNGRHPEQGNAVMLSFRLRDLKPTKAEIAKRKQLLKQWQAEDKQRLAEAKKTK